MVKKLLLLIWCFNISLLSANELKKDAWIIESNNRADGAGVVQKNSIELTRGAQGADKYMLRAFQDVPVEPGAIYQLSYKIKATGGGSGNGLIYFGDRQGKWDVKHIKYAPYKAKCDLTEVTVNVTAPADTVKFRVDLRAMGANAKVFYQDIKLDKVGSDKKITLTPRNEPVKLDGKLTDPLWKNALKLSPFRVLDNVSQTSSVANEVRLALKGNYLYIGYRLEEPQMGGMKVSHAAKLAIYADDCVETFISTDQKYYTHFLVNSAAVKYAVAKQPGNSWYAAEKSEYNGSWEVATWRGDKEWTVEMRLNLTDIFHDKNLAGKQTLFVNFTRHRTQGNEPNQTWAPLTGAFYSQPQSFVPITLAFPVSGKLKDTSAAKFTKRLTVPKLLIAGNPVKIILTKQSFKLPAVVKVDDQTATIDRAIIKSMRQSVAVGKQGSVDVVLNIQRQFQDSQLSAADLSKLQNSEAFKLSLAPGKISILGRTKAGVLRGIATLMLLAKRGKFLPGAQLPALTIYDAPGMHFRGWLISDSSPAELKRSIDLAYLLRLNKLMIMLDSWGGKTKFPFDSYPLSNKMTTKKQWVELFNYARARGIEPIPYFASWGRGQYFKNLPDGVKLLVDDEDVLQDGYRNLDVANPAACKIMLDLQAEIIDTLKPKAFCIAMDEIHFGHVVTSVAAKRKKWGKSDWFLSAIRQSYQLFKQKNVKLYIWGDMLDPKQNGMHMDISGAELLKKLPQDITILDWKYNGDKDFNVDFPSIGLFKQHGFKVIGAPWFKSKNITRLANAVKHYQAEGLCLTSWSTTRVGELKPELIRALGLAAFYSWSPEDCNLANLNFLPDSLVHGAAYWSSYPPKQKKIISLTAHNNQLVGGDQLLQVMGVSQAAKVDFIATPFTNYRGVGVKVFTANGAPAALVVRNSADKPLGVVANGKFSSNLESWVKDNVKPGDIVEEQETLKITAPATKAFMRLFQDIHLDPQTQYTLRYKVKVTGPGNAKVWLYAGDKAFKWSSANIIYSNSKAGNWSEKTVKLHPKTAAVRICFSASTAGTTVWFDDIELLNGNQSATAQSTTQPRVTIPINAPAKVLTFMHATNYQVLKDDMPAMDKKFMGMIPGRYEIIYTDGSSTKISLKYRKNILAVNDKNLGREQDVALFGIVGDRFFCNLPTFTWVNPSPEKTIKALQIIPGNSKELALILFGITLEN